MTRPSGSGDPDGIGGSRKGGLPPGLQQLAALLADGLGEFANATLSLDAASAARLAALEGSSLLIQARAASPGPAELSFSLQVSDGRLRLLAGAVAAPNAIVSGSLADLLGWALSRGRQNPAGLRVDGDTRLLETLAEISQGYRPDLGQPLGRLLGTPTATRVLAAAEVAVAGMRSLLQGAAAGVRQGAAQWFATDRALAGFLDELDELKLSVDRLAAQVLAAEARAAGHQGAAGSAADDHQAVQQPGAERQRLP